MLDLHCYTRLFCSCGEQWLLFIAIHWGGFSCYGAQALGTRASVVVTHRLNICSTWALAASRWVESSQTRDWTHVPCIERRIPTHCTTKKSWSCHPLCQLSLDSWWLHWTHNEDLNTYPSLWSPSDLTLVDPNCWWLPWIPALQLRWSSFTC